MSESFVEWPQQPDLLRCQSESGRRFWGCMDEHNGKVFVREVVTGQCHSVDVMRELPWESSPPAEPPPAELPVGQRRYREGTRVYDATHRILVDTYTGMRTIEECEQLAEEIANAPAADAELRRRACSGCGLNEAHKSCPAYGTPAYMNREHPAWGSVNSIVALRIEAALAAERAERAAAEGRCAAMAEFMQRALVFCPEHWEGRRDYEEWSQSLASQPVHQPAAAAPMAAIDHKPEAPREPIVIAGEPVLRGDKLSIQGAKCIRDLIAADHTAMWESENP